MWYNIDMENLDLLHYIEQARKSGMGDEQIRQGLLQGGWQEANINEAMTKTQPVTASQLKSKAMMSKTLAVVFTTITIAVVGYAGAGYYLANYQDLPLWPFEVPVELIPTPTPRPAVLPSSEDVALQGWQTYRNEEYGFEVKYPNDWQIYKQSTSELFGLSKEYSAIPNRNPEDMTGACLLGLYNIIRKPNEDLKIWLKRINQEGGNPAPQNLADITIGSKNGIKEIGGEIGTSYSVYLPLESDQVLSISLGCGADVESKGVGEFDQILSTFRFIDDIDIQNNQLTCALINGTAGNVLINSPAIFSALGGDGVYAWSIFGATPSHGEGGQFSTVPPTIGIFTVIVTSGSLSATCNVSVVAP